MSESAQYSSQSWIVRSEADRLEFQRLVRDALGHLYDPVRLQSHPLTPFLPDASARPSSVGRALRQALLDAVESLKPSVDLPPSKRASRAYQILKLRYVDALEIPQVLDRLSLSESIYYLDLARAIQGVSAILWERWGPGQSRRSNEAAGLRSEQGQDRGAGSTARYGRAGRTGAAGALEQEAKERPPTNLPVQLTSFVGREREMAEVRRLLGTARLLTLMGSGGCGKTRLAYQVVEGLIGDAPEAYPDGIWVVELAPLADPQLVPQATASSLGLRQEAAGDPLDTLIDHLRQRRLLLVLDNCEHLLDASARLVDSLLRACPKLKVLATSREALRIAGDVSFRVPSLSLPDLQKMPPLDKLAEYESIRLLVERARAVQPSFALSTTNARFVAEIVIRLDGIPLAIELAAALVRGLAVEQISRRLDDRFRLLTGGSRAALPRQQTLRATIDWSYDLLDAAEAVLFRRLAVFAGGFSLEAAEEVCADQAEEEEAGREEAGGVVKLERDQVLELLLRLVDRSLVVAEESVLEVRYRLLETIREYAGRKLAESGEVTAIRDRHRACYQHFFQPVRSRLFSGQPEEMGRYFGLLALEHDNLRAALSWCLQDNPTLGVEFVGQTLLHHFWIHLGFASEGRYWIRELLVRLPERDAARLLLLDMCVWLASDLGDLDEAKALAEEQLEIARGLEDPKETILGLMAVGETVRQQGDRGRARALLKEARALAMSMIDVRAEPWVAAAPSYYLGITFAGDADYREARTYFEEAIARFGLSGGVTGIVVPSAMLGFLEQVEGNYPRARSLLEEGVATLRKGRDQAALGWSLSLLGCTLARDGEQERGVSLLRESLVLLRGQGHRLRLGRCLSFLAVLEGERGDHTRAVRLIGAAMKIIGEAQPEFFASERVDREASLAAARAVLGEEAFARAWAEGQAMTLEQAVEYALAEPLQD